MAFRNYSGRSGGTRTRTVIMTNRFSYYSMLPQPHLCCSLDYTFTISFDLGARRLVSPHSRFLGQLGDYPLRTSPEFDAIHSRSFLSWRSVKNNGKLIAKILVPLPSLLRLPLTPHSHINDQGKSSFPYLIPINKYRMTYSIFQNSTPHYRLFCRSLRCFRLKGKSTLNIKRLHIVVETQSIWLIETSSYPQWEASTLA